MSEPSDISSQNVGPQESRKRRREVITVIFVGILLLFLTWTEFKLFGISQKLPFEHSIFFFGLVNFNIILILVLFFLAFRNVVKVFVERQGKMIGSSLKAKLIAAFLMFSAVPTVLIFLVSLFYINSSFDKWFNVKMAGVLKNSMDVTNAYYVSSKKRNYHFAHQIAENLEKAHLKKPDKIKKMLEQQLQTFSLDSVEYYPDLYSPRVVVVPKNRSIPVVPSASMEFLEKGVVQGLEASTIHYFKEGNLVRVIVPVKIGAKTKAAVVVSTFVPLSLISRMDAINSAYEDVRGGDNPLEYPIKSIYLVTLILMTLVILLCASWFAIYLANQLSVPLESLGQATVRVAKGDYRPVRVGSKSAEINRLVANFNSMIITLAKSEREVRAANRNLKETLNRLDDHTRYVEVVLSNVSTGVMAVDQTGTITTINRHAGQLLKIEPQKYIGKNIEAVLGDEYFKIFVDLVKSMKRHRAESLQKEIRVNIGGRTVPLQMSLSLLFDEKRQELGKVLVFDDLTVLLNAQRAAAWTEVARRIAHEIKNPLTPIKLSAQRLEKKFGPMIEDQAFSECTSMIIKQVDELKNLVNEFSQFARMPKTVPVQGSVNKAIEESLVLYRNGHKECRFEFEKDESLPEFKFDQEQIKRVIVNLLDNSVAAVSDISDGKIAITTHYDSLLKIVRITVADNGFGIQDQFRERIFEPYFSTKEGGTGLGLAIVKRIIEDHNGFIRAFPNSTKGTRVVIELPIVDTEGPQTIHQLHTDGPAHG